MTPKGKPRKLPKHRLSLKLNSKRLPHYLKLSKRKSAFLRNNDKRLRDSEKKNK